VAMALETSQISLDEVVSKAIATVKAAEKNRGVKVPLGLIRLADYSMHVVNSLGVNFTHRGTMVFSYFKSKATTGASAGEGIEKVWSTSISKFDPEDVGNSIAEKALATMKAESFKGESDVIALVTPVELFAAGFAGYAEGLISVVNFATNAEQVNKKRSPWINQLGAKVASDKLTVWDDGRQPGGIKAP